MHPFRPVLSTAMGRPLHPELRNEVSSVELMPTSCISLQRSLDGILPGGEIFTIGQGESYDTSFLQ
jgi:hypothetical protein